MIHHFGHEQISSLKFLKGPTVAILSLLGISLRATYDTSLGHEHISSLKILKGPTVAVLSSLGYILEPPMIHHLDMKKSQVLSS